MQDLERHLALVPDIQRQVHGGHASGPELALDAKAIGESGTEPFEGRALADVMSVIPDGATVFVSSSMPVRDLDAFGGASEKSITAISNRGANGIDGVISTALGVAAVSDG